MIFPVTELGAPWDHVTGQNYNLWVRISRSLNGYEQTDIETLKQNNIMLREKLMGLINGEYKELMNRCNALINSENGGLDAKNASYQNFLENLSDVTKPNDSSSSRSRNRSPRDSSKKKSKSTMDRGNVDKSNESLNLNNFDEDQGKEKFGGSSIFGSTESLFEERADDGDDINQEDRGRIGESSKYGNKHGRFSIRARGDMDDEVRHYINNLQQQYKFCDSRSGGFFKNTALGKMFRRLNFKLKLKMLRYIRNKAQNGNIKVKPGRLFNAWVRTVIANNRWMPSAMVPFFYYISIVCSVPYIGNSLGAILYIITGIVGVGIMALMVIFHFFIRK
ncbi:hypothetical protein AK88_04610 [Plasmodium fragile]|uniref:Uncharacterized protein n=1 Tax=Plasmodium fragile TaxID=5857 RepID=A0A0D9QFC9_PLAFR|nr:uncharacterized protein AK88_04610 [Plasmodium fragile]KJP85740.1 hypothetical protein AK88_04610 [Plasmodium fragile]